MSKEIQFKIQIEVDESFNTVFAYKQTQVLNSFSKEGLLEVINDFSNDVKMLINRSSTVTKTEDRYLLENKQA